MVCPRCITSVESILVKNGLEGSVNLGEVVLSKEPSNKELVMLADDLKRAGFELLDDQKQQVIEQVKNLLIQKVQSGEVEEHFSLSKFLTDKIFRDYSSISRLFSQVEGITVEQFFILQKIEKTKELLMYDEQSLNQVAFNLGYSSTQHLSSQFKKVTGLTPSHFKSLKERKRRSIDEI